MGQQVGLDGMAWWAAPMTIGTPVGRVQGGNSPWAAARGTDREVTV